MDRSKIGRLDKENRTKKTFRERRNITSREKSRNSLVAPDPLKVARFSSDTAFNKNNKRNVGSIKLTDSDDDYEAYELTFFGDQIKITLNDDNWESILMDGGKALMTNENKSVQEHHEEPISREESPLSYLFQLYLTISGKPRTDPEILGFICKYLTGVKKAYLTYLVSKYICRIRVVKKFPGESMERK